jgi:hypothetical protein
MGRGTVIEDVEYTLDKLPGVIGKIRDMSTAYLPGRQTSQRRAS